MKEKYYITTPIYYPSGNWHIGHCYTTVVCDAFARYNRMLGKDVFFLTGTDEHGQKVEKKAAEAGVTPLEFIDPLVAELKEIWKALDINYSKFIRTTDEEHVKAVQVLCHIYFVQLRIAKVKTTFCLCENSSTYTRAFAKEIILGGNPSLSRQGLGSIATLMLNVAAGAFGDAAIAGMSIVTRIFVLHLCDGHRYWVRDSSRSADSATAPNSMGA